MAAFVKFEIQCKSPSFNFDWIGTGHCEVFDIDDIEDDEAFSYQPPQQIKLKLAELKDAYRLSEYRILRTITQRDVIYP